MITGLNKRKYECWAGQGNCLGEWELAQGVGHGVVEMLIAQRLQQLLEDAGGQDLRNE